MSEITINFETLKFNLYDILNISKDASESKIKKAFRNLILNFHPDKNSEAEDMGSIASSIVVKKITV